MHDPDPAAFGTAQATEPGANGTLGERVRALRLRDRLATSSPGSSATWIPWLLCVFMAIAWVSLGSRWYRTQNPEAAPPANDVAPAATNAAPRAIAQEAPPNDPNATVLVARGYIVPAHRISISPIEVSGRVIELNFQEGQSIQKDTVLARLDPTSYKADLDEATARYKFAKASFDEIRIPRPEEIDRVKAELAEAQQQLKQAELEYRRNKELLGAALSREVYERSQYNFFALRERVNRLREQLDITEHPRVETVAAAWAEVLAAQARVRRAEFRYDNCWIRAPITGTILTKKAELGNLINPVVGGISTSLCDMADLSDLEVELDIQEREIAKIQPRQACRIKADAYPARQYQGYVDRIMPIADRAKGAIPIRVQILVPPEEQGTYLKPEMNAVVTFINRAVPAAKPVESPE